MYEVSGVPYYELSNILPKIDKYLDKVIPYTGGRYAREVFTILLCCGDYLNEWYDPLFELLYQVASLNKCDLAEVLGRKGWVRKLKDLGFKQTMWIVEREI